MGEATVLPGELSRGACGPAGEVLSESSRTSAGAAWDRWTSVSCGMASVVVERKTDGTTRLDLFDAIRQSWPFEDMAVVVRGVRCLEEPKRAVASPLALAVVHAEATLMQRRPLCTSTTECISSLSPVSESASDAKMLEKSLEKRKGRPSLPRAPPLPPISHVARGSWNHHSLNSSRILCLPPSFMIQTHHTSYAARKRFRKHLVHAGMLCHDGIALGGAFCSYHPCRCRVDLPHTVGRSRFLCSYPAHSMQPIPFFSLTFE